MGSLVDMQEIVKDMELTERDSQVEAISRYLGNQETSVNAVAWWNPNVRKVLDALDVYNEAIFEALN